MSGPIPGPYGLCDSCGKRMCDCRYRLTRKGFVAVLLTVALVGMVLAAGITVASSRDWTGSWDLDPAERRGMPIPVAHEPEPVDPADYADLEDRWSR